MSNKPGASARREEEIAFLLMERVLGVKITLADAGGGNAMPDGRWLYLDGSDRRAIAEVTSPPETELLKRWAQAKRTGGRQDESGSLPIYLNQLAEYVEVMLNTDWARANIDKLLAHEADERHLFLHAHGYGYGNYFYRLSDKENTERIDGVKIPEGISDVWFRGRATRREHLGTTLVQLSRFNEVTGWTRYVVAIEEKELPPPPPSLADDEAPASWREPKVRSEPTEMS